MCNRGRSPDRPEEARRTRPDAPHAKNTRTTCDLCQKRKVRCDRTKPRCLRCLRGGQVCTYPADETSRINTELQSLQSRLGQAEAKLAEHGLSLQSGSPAASISDSLTTDLPGIRPITQPPLQAILPDLAPFSNPTDRPDGEFHFDFNDWNPTTVFDIFQHGGPEPSHPTPAFEHLDPSQNTQASHPPNHVHPRPHTSRQCSPVVTGLSDQELTHDLSQVYFHSVQPYFPLLDRDDFFRLNAVDAPAVVALKSAVCMAGAQMTKDVALERRFYLESRASLEKAELHDDASQFATLESAQTLLLLARHELTHNAFQRALMTLARLAQLLLIIYPYAPISQDYRDQSGSPSSIADNSSATVVEPLTQLTHHERPKRSLLLLTFALYYVLPHGLAHEALFTSHSFDPDLFPTSAMSRASQDHNTILKGMNMRDETDDLETVFLVAELYAAVRRHHNNTIANAEGTGAPDYNFCLAHETLEAKIDPLLSTIASAPCEDSPQKQMQAMQAMQPQDNFRVLALLIILGARILLYTTAPINSRKASFLRAVGPECRKIAVITANDFCATLSQSGLLHPDRATDFRELRIFLMPMMVLVAEAQLSMLREEENQDGHKSYVIGSETRRCLEVILGAMEPWKDDAAVYANCVCRCRSFLDRPQNNPKNRRGRDYMR
ncbi:hypothetical protein F4861DRAFT_142567 [Xylaria intraflava]|nr:hypothetical protein F4861DRAFT_142567 [Xylaria intraflava]